MRRRYVYIDGILTEVPKDWSREPQADYHVMPDIGEYRSMIDGSVITSRSRHREHLRQHGCIEVGNDPLATRAQRQPAKNPPGLKDAIIRAVNQYEERTRR